MSYTLLEAVNELLLTTGERSVSSIGVPHSVKAKDALRQAYYDLCASGNWSFTRRISPTSLWNGDTATIPGLTRLFDVSYHQGNGRSFLLNQCSPDFYPVNDPVEGTPTCYLYTGDEQVRVYPYPPVDDRPRVVFQYEFIPEFPPSENQEFQLPNMFIPLLLRGGQYFFALSHLDDAQSAAAYKNAYDELLMRYRVRNTNTGNSFNMFRRRG